MQIINIIAIVLSPIIAVIVGQLLHNMEKKRADKVDIFKTLMINRGLGWSMESVKALNTIEVVFSNDKKVLEQWKKYYEKLCIDNPSITEQAMIKMEGDKLIELIAGTLGYKDNVTWETIQKPYVPKGLITNLNQQQQFQNAQLSVLSQMDSYIQQMGEKFPNLENNKSQNEM